VLTTFTPLIVADWAQNPLTLESGGARLIRMLGAINVRNVGTAAALLHSHIIALDDDLTPALAGAAGDPSQFESLFEGNQLWSDHRTLPFSPTGVESLVQTIPFDLKPRRNLRDINIHITIIFAGGGASVGFSAWAKCLIGGRY